MSLSHNAFTYTTSAPRPEDFVRLRADCGWGVISLDAARRALCGSLFDVTCFDGTELVGMGRVVGDGALYFYLQDIIVTPSHQGHRVGHQIVQRLMARIREQAPVGATIGLMSAQGKEAFYQKFGFQQRPDQDLGAGMTQFIFPDTRS